VRGARHGECQREDESGGAYGARHLSKLARHCVCAWSLAGRSQFALGRSQRLLGDPAPIVIVAVEAAASLPALKFVASERRKVAQGDPSKSVIPPPVLLPRGRRSDFRREMRDRRSDFRRELRDRRSDFRRELRGRRSDFWRELRGRRSECRSDGRTRSFPE